MYHYILIMMIFGTFASSCGDLCFLLKCLVIIINDNPLKTPMAANIMTTRSLARPSMNLVALFLDGVILMGVTKITSLMTISFPWYWWFTELGIMPDITYLHLAQNQAYRLCDHHVCSRIIFLSSLSVYLMANGSW